MIVVVFIAVPLVRVVTVTKVQSISHAPLLLLTVLTRGHGLFGPHHLTHLSH
jgi:hypothetical protein